MVVVELLEDVGDLRVVLMQFLGYSLFAQGLWSVERVLDVELDLAVYKALTLLLNEFLQLPRYYRVRHLRFLKSAHNL